MKSVSRLPSRLARWGSAHPLPVDVAFALLVGGLSLSSYLVTEPEGTQRDQDAFGVLLVALQTVGLMGRRWRPLASMIAVVAPTVVFWVSDYPTNFDAFTVLAVYAATAHGGDDRRRVWSVVGGTVAVITVIALLGVLVPTEDLPPAAVIGIAAIHLTAAVTGEVVHDRRRRVHELEQRATRAEAERELLTRQAVLDERSRIARDLHDVVAHSMSVMVVQAGAAQRIVGIHPARAAEAIEQVQTTGREALSEMRRMLGVLRDERQVPLELAPRPTMDEVEGIVQHCVEAGVPTELTVEGERPGRAAGPEMAGYRIVQEALTNVIKHAGRPANAAVKVTYADDLMRLEIIDDGRGATTREIESTTGHGLIGMRERVDLYQGTLHAGPRPGGGFRVAAVIPLDVAPATAPGVA